MTIEVLGGDIHLIDLQTRLPFRYGIATMTEAPHAFVRLHVLVDGQHSTGVAADFLPPKWFTKVPDTPLQTEILEMLTTIEVAVDLSVGSRAETPFELWQDLYERQAEWGRHQEWPPLLVNFGMTLVERAMLEAVALVFQVGCQQKLILIYQPNQFMTNLQQSMLELLIRMQNLIVA